MCLAVPVRVVELKGGDSAVVDLGGVRKEVSLALVEDVSAGDYVILHVGYALTKLDPAEAERTLALFAEAGVIDGRFEVASPVEGEDGRGNTSSARTRSEPASSFEGEVGRGMGLTSELRPGNPSPPLPPPLEGDERESGAAAGRRA